MASPTRAEVEAALAKIERGIGLDSGSGSAIRFGTDSEEGRMMIRDRSERQIVRWGIPFPFESFPPSSGDWLDLFRFWTPPILAILISATLDLNPERPEATRTLAMAALLGGWWTFQALPLAVTALFPLVLFPVLGIMDTAKTAQQYTNYVIFIFLGGFLVALTMERWNLHKRLALSVLMRFHRPRRLLLAFMLTTFFLSMWISNTATTLMMLPIAESVIQSLQDRANEKHKKERQLYDIDLEVESIPIAASLDIPRPSYGSRASHPDANMPVGGLEMERICDFGKAVFLSVAYSATIGGAATLIGTPTNLTFVRIFGIIFPEAPSVSFSDWFIFATPLCLILLFCTWFILVAIYCGGLKSFAIWRKSLFGGSASSSAMEEVSVWNIDIPTDELRRQYDLLGPMEWEESVSLTAFVLLAVLWIFRAPMHFGAFTVPGWVALFSYGSYINDATVAIFISLLLFVIPARSRHHLPSHIRRREEEKGERSEENGSAWEKGGEGKQPPKILDWETAAKIPLDILLLFGGGFALASAFKESGLSHYIAVKFVGLSSFSPFWITFIIGLILSFATELTSNMTTAEMSLPIVASLAVVAKINPLLLMIPTTIACSFAFMLPPGTAPNAIVFSSGRLTIPDMVRAGFIISLIGMWLLPLFMFSWGLIVFQINPAEFPLWAST